MTVFEPRRCQQQSRGTLFRSAIACLLLCACDGGTGRPLVFADDGSAGSSSSRRDASVDENGASETADCARLTDTWSPTFAMDEMDLVTKINMLRSDKSEVCGAPLLTLEPVESDPRFQCTARLRVSDDNSRKGPNARASVMPIYASAFDQNTQELNGLRDRQRRAGIKAQSVVAEFVFYNVDSVQGVIAVLEGDLDAAKLFCTFALSPFPVVLVGAARSNNVWVLDFGSTYPPISGRPPSSGTGNSGRGTSGTGAR